MNRFLPLILISVGIFLFFTSAGIYFYRQSPERLRVEISEKVIESASANGEPKYIEINELDIALPVFPTKFDDKAWKTTDEGVSYVSEGIFYGHNWGSILGNLKSAKIGQYVKVFYTDGRYTKYKVVEKTITSPNDRDILTGTNSEKITIYTCTGFLDSERLVLKAEKIS